MAPLEVIDVDALEDVDPDAYEQEQLAAAIAASLADVLEQPAIEPPAVVSALPPRSRPFLIVDHSHSDPSSTTGSDFLKERAALERARLERLKRLRSADDDAAFPSQSPGAGSSSEAKPDRTIKRV